MTGSADGPLGGAAPAPALAPPAAAPSAGPASAARGGRRTRFEQRFAAANTTSDGKLTKEQAQAAHMRLVVRHFDEIDSAHKGYVTVDDLRAYRRTQAAARRAHRAAATQ